MDLYFRTSLFLWFKRASRFAKKKLDYHKSIKKNSKTRGTKGGGPENNMINESKEMVSTSFAQF